MAEKQGSSFKNSDSLLPPLPSIRMERQKLSESVYEIISEYIVSGKLKPRQRLREAEIARGLDVSRTPVREAFARLETEHLLERDSTGAYFVTSWDRERLQQLAIVRSTLESLTASIVCSTLGAEDYDYLQNLIARMESALHREDFDALIRLDITFHSYLWGKTNYPILKNLLESIKTQVLYFMYLTLPGDEEDYPSMHQTLLDVFREQDPDKAGQIMHDHILVTAEKAIQNMRDI